MRKDKWNGDLRSLRISVVNAVFGAGKMPNLRGIRVNFIVRHITNNLHLRTKNRFENRGGIADGTEIQSRTFDF